MAEGKSKRYILYRFPSLNGSPKRFRWKWVAALYGYFWSFVNMGSVIFELKDLQTGEYLAYWI